MALDEALMARARRTGETVLRVYAWSTPTLSLGRHQRAAGVYDPDLLARHGIEVVRRPTGGRALIHHREVTYSVTAPVIAGETVRSTYDRINALLALALGSLGVPVAIAAPTEPARAPTSLPCFAEPAAGELVLDGRKLAGSAQWRDDGALLQHGSILVDDDQSALSLLTLEPAVSVDPPATLREALGRAVEPRDVADALAAAVRASLDPHAAPLALDEETRRDAACLTRRYRDDAWTWRR
jgi:lipoate-protein ligase A